MTSWKKSVPNLTRMEITWFRSTNEHARSHHPPPFCWRLCIYRDVKHPLCVAVSVFAKTACNSWRSFLLHVVMPSHWTVCVTRQCCLQIWTVCVIRLCFSELLYIGGKLPTMRSWLCQALSWKCSWDWPLCPRSHLLNGYRASIADRHAAKVHSSVYAQHPT